MTPTADLGTPHLHLERRGQIAWCVLDRPEAKNALTPEMYRGIGRAIRVATNDPDLRALVITGTKDVFMPGGDVRAHSQEADGPPISETVPFRELWNATIPVVAAINGLCQASGLTIAMLSDSSVASDRATFRAPELTVGFLDTWLAALLPVHIGMGRARDFVLSGRQIGAEEALQIGLISRVADHESLEQEATEAALQLLESAPAARRAWKALANARYGAIDESALNGSAHTPEATEGFSALLERRAPSWSPRSGSR